MKKSRQPVLSIGALLGAACFANAQSLIPSVDEHVPLRGDDPKGYVLVATLKMHDTMDGRKDLVEWACYADYDIEGDRPALRRTTWLVGTLKRAPGLQKGIPLWDIGAQHRSSTLMVRVVSKKPGAKTTLKKSLITVDANGNEIETPEPDPVENSKGFYTIDPRPVAQKAKPQYRLKSDDAALRLEVYYLKHPPGDKTKQEEDGGPPSIPPVSEN